MIRTLFAILLSLMMVGCAANYPMAYMNPHGQSKDEVCAEYSNTLSGNKLCRWNFQDMWIYDPINKTEIIFSNEVKDKYFIFENVTQPMKCPLPLPYLVSTCFYGDGVLKDTANNYAQAKGYADLKFMAELVKQQKIQEEKDAKEEIVKKQNIVKLYEKQYGFKCSSDKSDLDRYSSCLDKRRAEEKDDKEELARKQNIIKLYAKQYGFKCSSDKSDLDRYSSCLLKMRAEALEIEQAKERQKVLQGELENSDIAKTCLGFGYKKGTEKYADCMKDLYLQQNAATKNNSNNNSSSYSNSKYADEMLEIERAKAKALEDSANAQRNRNQSDAMMELSRRLLNNNTPAPTIKQPLNCRSVRVGNTVQTQCQ